MTKNSETFTAATLRKVILTRLMEADRLHVFNAWTDQKQLARWWGPRGFTNPVCRLDVRSAGAIRIDMRGPDGVIYPMKGFFHEILIPERIVFTSNAFEDETNKAQLEVFNTVTFESQGNNTKLTLRAVIVKAALEVEDSIAGMHEGWSQSLERLAAIL